MADRGWHVHWVLGSLLIYLASWVDYVHGPTRATLRDLSVFIPRRLENLTSYDVKYSL